MFVINFNVIWIEQISFSVPQKKKTHTHCIFICIRVVPKKMYFSFVVCQLASLFFPRGSICNIFSFWTTLINTNSSANPFNSSSVIFFFTLLFLLLFLLCVICIQNRPRTQTGMIVFAMATFGCSLPHFIFGDDLLHSTNTLYGGGVHNVETAISTSSQNLSTSAVGMDGGASFIGNMQTMSTRLNLCQNSNGNFTDSGGRCSNMKQIQ